MKTKLTLRSSIVDELSGIAKPNKSKKFSTKDIITKYLIEKYIK